MPEPKALPPGSTGWEKIAEVGGWICALSEFSTVKAVPPAFREKWGRLVDVIVRHILEAATDDAVNCALLWFLALPQLMLRQVGRGGKKGQGHAALALRFDLAMTEDWGKLLDLWFKDKEEFARKRVERGKRNFKSDQEEVEKKRETVLGLMSRGQVGRAARLISSNGVASTDDPVTMAALSAKYVARVRELPKQVSKGKCIESAAGLRELWLDLEPGVSPGTGGMRGEFLTCLAEVWEEEEMERFQQFVMLYLTAELPPWFFRVWAAVSTVPTFKTADRHKDKLRPIGVKGSLPRSIHKLVARKIKPELRAYLEPQQLCLTPGGGSKLVHAVRMLMEQNRDWVCVKLDVANAHNSISRASIIETVESEPSLRHLSTHIASTLAAPTALEVRGRRWGEAGDGLVQGDGRSSGDYAVGWHPEVRSVDAKLAKSGGCGLFGHDDGYLLGPPAPVYAGLADFELGIGERGLQLQRSKTKVFCWGDLPACTPPDLERAGVKVNGNFFPGMEVYGVGVGCTEYVQHYLNQKVKDLGEVVIKSCNLLEGDLQAQWNLLSASVSQKLSYTLSLQYPSDVKLAAVTADKLLWAMLESATQLKIPRRDEGKGVECVLAPPVSTLATTIPGMAGKATCAPRGTWASILPGFVSS